jgi:hypothetical protein
VRLIIFASFGVASDAKFMQCDRLSKQSFVARLCQTPIARISWRFTETRYKLPFCENQSLDPGIDLLSRYGHCPSPRSDS